MKALIVQAAGSRGAASLEFAVILPFLVFTMLGVADYGNALQQMLRLQGAARAGAQVMMTRPNDMADIRTAAVAYLTGWQAAPANCTIGTSAGICVMSDTRCQLVGSRTDIDCGDVPAGTDYRKYALVTVTRPYAPLFIVPQRTLRGNVEIRLR